MRRLYSSILDYTSGKNVSLAPHLLVVEWRTCSYLRHTRRSRRTIEPPIPPIYVIYTHLVLSVCRSEWEPRRFHRDLQEIDLRAMERDSSDDESGDEAGKRRPKPNLLDKTNKEEKNGGIGPTAPPYKSVSHVVGYAPANTTSHCKVCGKGFIPKRIR